MERYTVTFTIASDEDPSEILDQVIAMCEDLEAGDVPEESVCVTDA